MMIVDKSCDTNLEKLFFIVMLKDETNFQI